MTRSKGETGRVGGRVGGEKEGGGKGSSQHAVSLSSMVSAQRNDPTKN